MARHEAIVVLVQIALGLRGTERREEKCWTGVCSVTVLDINDIEKKQSWCRWYGERLGGGFGNLCQ